MKIAIVVGHHPGAPGATYHNYSEYMVMAPVAGALVEALQEGGHEAWLVGASSLGTKINRVNELNADIGLELHMNAHTDTSASGYEVLHAGSEKGVALADLISDCLVVAGLRDRGVKLGRYRQDPNEKVIPILKDTNCPFAVLELGFISNPEDLYYVRVNKAMIARRIALGCELWVRKFLEVVR